MLSARYILRQVLWTCKCFEQFMELEQNEVHLKGKKRYPDDTGYPLTPGLPECGICEIRRRFGRKWDKCLDCNDGYVTLSSTKEIMHNLVHTCPNCRGMGPDDKQCIRCLDSNFTQELSFDWSSEEKPKSRNLYQHPSHDDEEEIPNIRQANIPSNNADMLTDLVIGSVVGPPKPTEVPDTYFPCLDCEERATYCDGRYNDCTEAHLTPPNETNKFNTLER
jgi:hypothetical protein